MNETICNDLKSINFDLLKDNVLFVSKLTNDPLVMKITDIRLLEKEHNKILNKIDKNVIIKCSIIRENKIFDSVLISLGDIWFTDRLTYPDGTSIIRLLA